MPVIQIVFIIAIVGLVALTFLPRLVSNPLHRKLATNVGTILLGLSVLTLKNVASLSPDDLVVVSLGGWGILGVGIIGSVITTFEFVEASSKSKTEW